MLIKLTQENYDDIIRMSANVLNGGGIIAYPTETLYGLGAKYDIEHSLERIFRIKNRPEEKSLTLIIGNPEQLILIADSIPDVARDMMQNFWPGPLTLVLKAKKGIQKSLVLNDTVAVRIPGDSFALRLAMAIPYPITATSANISNQPAAQDASTILNYFNDKLDLIIDGGKTPGEPPSTIVDVTENNAKVIRQGAIDIGSFLKERGTQL